MTNSLTKMAAPWALRKHCILLNLLQYTKRQQTQRLFSVFMKAGQCNYSEILQRQNLIGLGWHTPAFIKLCSNSALCWKCKKPVSRLSYGQYSCECGVLQPPNEGVTYFEMMGENQTYFIDQSELTKKFRDLQSRLHPDKFSQRPEREQEHSRMHSTLINKAYRTLQDPLSRALYLLDLCGESVDEDNKIVDQEFLMEIMELNEEVAEIDNAQKYSSVLEKNNQSLNALFGELDIAFRDNDIKRAKYLVIRLKYFSNLQEKLREQRHLYDSS